MITTLKDYYKSKQQNLPGIKDRANVYETIGLGKATDYRGAYDQNVSLLNRLQSAPTPKPATPIVTPKPVTPTPTAAVTPAPVAPPAPAAPEPDNSYSGLVDTLKKKFGIDTLINSITSAIGTQPKKADLYNAELTNAGVESDRTALKSLDDKMTGIDSALNQSDKDIRDRINASGGIVTDSQVQRLIAQEKAPLINEYNILNKSRGTLADRINASVSNASKMAELKYSDSSQPLDNAKSMLSTISPEFSQSLSAGEKDLATRIAEIETKKKEAEAEVKAEASAKKAALDQDKSMALKGYKYISNPQELTKISTQTNDVQNIGGRIYVKPTVNKLAEYEAKKQIDAKYKKTGGSSGGGGTSDAKLLKQAEKDMTAKLAKVKGPDGKVSPQDYIKLKNKWIEKDLNPTTFDTKFKGFRNPDNPYYGVTKETSKGRTL